MVNIFCHNQGQLLQNMCTIWLSKETNIIIIIFSLHFLLAMFVGMGSIAVCLTAGSQYALEELPMKIVKIATV